MSGMASWVTAQLAVLDAGPLYLAPLPKAKGLTQARLCLRGGVDCLGNIARALRIPIPEDADPSVGISLSYKDVLEAIGRLLRVDFCSNARSRMRGRAT